MNTNVFLSIPTLIAQGVPKNKIACLLRDMWQLQMDTRLLMISHNTLVDPNFDITYHLEQVEEFINAFHISWTRCVEQFMLPNSFKRTYQFMEGLFEMNLDDMYALYDQQERIPLCIHIQSKYICSVYNYNRSILLVNLTLMPRENIINNYRQIRHEFLVRANQIQGYRNSHMNEFSPENKEYLMSLEGLFEETLSDDDETEIINFIS